MEKVLVTIKCMVFNQEPYLRECFDGFLIQKTKFPFEVIVHDDASTDGSKAIIQEYASKYPSIFKPLYETENQYSKVGFFGIIKMMNQHIHGKYVAICEGDDYWIDPCKLQKQVDYLERNLECGLVYTQSFQLDQKINKQNRGWSRQSSFYEMLINDNPICTPTTLFRCSLYKQYFDDIEIDDSWKMADLPLWLYLAYKSDIKFLDETTTVYRSLPQSASHSENIKHLMSFLNSDLRIRLYIANKFNSVNYLKRIVNYNINALFKLSVRFDKNISVYILKVAARNHYFSAKILLKSLLYSFSFGRKYHKHKYQ